MGKCKLERDYIDKKVYNYLVQHPDGMLMNIIYRELNEARMSVNFSVYRQAAEGKLKLVPMGRAYTLVKVNGLCQP